MKHVSTTTWPAVFADWRDREATNPDWVKTATAIKGWPDWESWRMFTADQLGLPDRAWSIYVSTDPRREIPAMLVGPYGGWQSRLPQPNVYTFADLAAIPEQARHFSGLKNMAEAWPAVTQFTGLRRPDSTIVCIEGHHRATAVALAARHHWRIHFGQVRLALADLRPDELNLLDNVLARGTTKNPPPDWTGPA